MADQYLTFTLNKTVYASDVSSIREVLTYEEPQTVPGANPIITGLIRSRGQSIAVIDMRKKFGLPTIVPNKETRIVIFEIVDPEHGTLNLLGAITDSVLEVLEIPKSELEPAPTAGNQDVSSYITGVSQKDNKFVIILDMQKIFSDQELTNILSLSDIQEENEQGDK